MRRQIPIVGGFYKDPNRHWSRQDCLNWIPVKAERAGALTEWQLRDAPGMKPAVQVHSGTGGIRGARNVEGKLFLVTGQKLYQISNTGVAIERGTVPGVGRVSMAHNAKGLGNELLTVNGSAGYVYDTTTQAFAKVTDPGYPGAFVADFVDQYLAQVEPQGRYWFHSDLADAHSYNTLDQYQAEGDPDRIVSLLVSHREVLIFGADTIEPYVNTGGSTGTFQRASNTVIECGCSARFTPRRMDNSAFWLDDNRLVRRLDGYNPVILSTEAIAGAFAECTPAEIAQAYAFTWEGAGHKVYYITVPGRFTFGYDAKSGEWHRRASYGLPHWAVSEIVFWNGKWYACDSRYPRLFELDPNYKLDGCDPLVRERTAQVIWADQNEVTLDELELMFGEPSEASECVAFPEQPEGPTISGSAPDGVVGLDYAPFDYTVTAGDNPLEGAALTTGSLPPGIGTLTVTAGITGGIPTTPGTYNFTVRQYDSAGLYDDHPDSIRVRVPWFGVSEDGATDGEGIKSAGGLDWSGTLDADLGGKDVFSGNGKVLVVTNDGGRTSSDYGVTWTPHVTPTTTVLLRGAYVGGVYMVGSNGGSDGGSTQQTRRSTDAINFSLVTLPSNYRATHAFAELEDRIFSFGVASVGGNYIYSDDAGLTWDGPEQCFTTNVDCMDACYSTTRLLVVGVAGNIAYSDDGEAWTQVTSPFGADDIVCCAWSDGRFVIVSIDGAIAHSPTGLTGTWTTAAYSCPEIPNRMDGFEGQFAIACADGVVVVSDGGVTWSLATSGFPGTSNVLGIAAYRPEEA